MRDKILAMEAGRELDGLIAEKVFGLRIDERKTGSWAVWDENGKWEWMKPYSTDISAAWEIIKNFKQKLFSVRNRFARELQQQMKTEDGLLLAWPDALIFLEPVHICKAALLAVIES